MKPGGSLMTCDHEFDTNTFLLSNPIQFRCKKCRDTKYGYLVLGVTEEEFDDAYSKLRQIQKASENRISRDK